MKLAPRVLTPSIAAVVLALAACSRTSSTAPAAVTPEPAATTPASADAPVPATAAPSSSAKAEPATVNPWTTAEDCSRSDDAGAHPDLSPEDRARSRSTCEAKEELRAFVAERQSCSSASECTNVIGACPFGCFIPVAKKSAPEVTTKLEALGARLDKAGNRCVYRCMAPPPEACVDGRCVDGAR